MLNATEDIWGEGAVSTPVDQGRSPGKGCEEVLRCVREVCFVIHNYRLYC